MASSMTSVRVDVVSWFRRTGVVNGVARAVTPLGLLLSIIDSPTKAGATAVLQASDLRNPTAIEDLRSGRTRVANAGWWGFDPKDATDAVQSAINSGAATVVIPYVGQPWVVRPLHLKSNQEIHFEPGVVLLAKEGEFRGPEDCLVYGQEVENVTLRGYGAILRMRKGDYTKDGYAKAEWRHTLGLKGARNVRVFGLTLESSGGDGIYIGSTLDERRVPCAAIHIKDCVCRDHHRQGISVISVIGLRIENCQLLGTRGTAPQAGIDFETDDASEQLSDIQMSNCILEGNAGGGFMFGLTRLNATSREVSIRIDDCLVRSSGGSGVCLLLHGNAQPRGLIEFRNCTFENTDYAGAHCVWNAAAPLNARFQGCRWRTVARRASEAPLHLEFHSSALVKTEIHFADCYLFDEQARMPLRLIAPETTNLVDAVAGEVNVYNDRALPLDPQITKRLPKLSVRLRSQGE